MHTATASRATRAPSASPRRIRKPSCRQATGSRAAPGSTTASIPSRRASRSRRWERNQSPRRTLSRDDGALDLVVNGGGPLVLVLERDGFLPVQRLVAPGWSEYGVVGDVVMVPYDATVNLIDLSQMSGAQAAQGSVAQDANGAR